MAEAFTVFEKFGDVCAELEEPDRKELIYAINMYGMFGEEVELPYMLKALFISLKEDIDNSKSARARGSKGGRPRGKQEVPEAEKPEVSENAKPEVSANKKPVVSDSEEPEVSGIQKPEVSENSKPKPNQTKPIQTKPKREKSASRFHPPTEDEVREYCREMGYEIDVPAFMAHYESNGWKVGRNPMKSWRAACTTWERRDHGGGKRDYSEYD